MEFNTKMVPNSSRILNGCCWLAAGWPAGCRLAGCWLAAGCDLLCARTFTRIRCFSCFLASAKRVAPLFWGLLRKVRPALRKAGRADPHVSPKWASFQEPPQSPCLVGLVFTSICDLLCAKRVALWDYPAKNTCDLGCGSEGQKLIEK